MNWLVEFYNEGIERLLNLRPYSFMIFSQSFCILRIDNNKGGTKKWLISIVVTKNKKRNRLQNQEHNSAWNSQLFIKDFSLTLQNLWGGVSMK